MYHGAHIGFILIWIKRIFANSGRNKKYIVSLFAILVLIGITGFSPSVARACIMSLTLIIAKLLFRSPDIVNSISISLIIILVINPFAILDIGLILSYFGTIGIVLFAKLFSKIKNYFLKIIAVSTSAQIFLVPIIAYTYCTIHLLFFISSLLGTPLCEIRILFGFVFILSFMPVAFIIKIPLEIALSIFAKVAQIISTIPISQLYIAKPNLFEVSLYYCIIIILLEKRIKLNKRKILIICLIIFLIIQIPKILPNNLMIFFIDVGQGDCTLIKTENHKTIMIDSGGADNLDEYDVGKKVLIPYLLARGITKLDYIMISHFHADHCNRFLSDNRRIENWKNVNCKARK